MNKFFNRYKFLLSVIALMAFLPIHNLYAYDWDTYYFAYEYETSDLAEYKDHYYRAINTDAWIDHDYEASGIDIDDSFVYAYTEADIWSNGEEFSDSIYISADADIGAYREYEWDGPPATAPGADIDGFISTEAEHNIYGARYPWQITAETDASSYTDGWAAAVVTDSGSNWDYRTAEMSTYGFVDSSDSDVDYSIYDDPDWYYWTNPYATSFAYNGTLTWGYDSSLDYEVSSGLTWFAVEACASAWAISYVFIDADESVLNEETWAVSDVNVDLDSIISVSLN